MQLSWDQMATKSTLISRKNYYTQVQEETAIYGMDNVGVKELVALIVGSKADFDFCQKLADMPITRLFSLGTRELQNLGATPGTAVKLEAAFRLAKKVQKASTHTDTIDSPAAAARALSFIANEEQEHFVVLLLDTKNQVIKSEIVTKGTLNSSLAHPREVFKVAIRENAKSIIIGHNHPSGDTTPSQNDVAATTMLYEAGKTVGIELLDSMIVSSQGYVSLKEKGLCF
ncbi:hypothetical protein CEB3_c13650 [Peptococcaceae bacterium CEB3]|nr:hypothetical protein CEB3_c13650 [Peptococcaceae bacterium CEB3]